MTDLAAVAPLLLVAGVFVGVCIVALRATDWRRLDDRRPVAPPEPDPEAAEPAGGSRAADDAADPASPIAAAESEPAAAAEASTRGTDPAAGGAEARDPAVAADAQPGARPGDESADPPRGHGRHRSRPGS